MFPIQYPDLWEMYKKSEASSAHSSLPLSVITCAQAGCIMLIDDQQGVMYMVLRKWVQQRTFEVTLLARRASGQLRRLTCPRTTRRIVICCCMCGGVAVKGLFSLRACIPKNGIVRSVCHVNPGDGQTVPNPNPAKRSACRTNHGTSRRQPRLVLVRN
eukprot:6258499-Amphidinium_carterae.2